MATIAASLIYRVAILFLMMAPGIILKKRGLVPVDFGKGIAGFVLYAAQPALVFLAYLQPYSSHVTKGMGWVLLYSVLAHALFIFFAFLFFRRAEPEKRRILRLVTVFSNAAFMGIPLIAVLLDQTALLYATVYNVVFNLVLWSLGVHICTYDSTVKYEKRSHATKKRSRRKFLRSCVKALFHPVTVAALLGLTVFFLRGAHLLPPIVTDALGMLQATVAPLSMVIIGLRLASTDFKGLFRDRYLYVFLLLRHLLLPFTVLVLLRIGNFFFPDGIDLTVAQVVLILASAPAASSATMFAEKYERDAVYAGKLVTVSTALSILTMPLFLLFQNASFK